MTLSPTATGKLGRGTESPQSPATKRQSVTGTESNRSESAGGNYWFVFSDDLPFDGNQVSWRSMSKSALSPMGGGSAGNVSPSRAVTETCAQMSLPEGEYVAARLEHLVEQGVQVSPSFEGRHQLVTSGLDTDTYGLKFTGDKSLPKEVEGFGEYLSPGTRVVLDHMAFSMIALSSLNQIDEGTKDVLRDYPPDYLIQQGRRQLDHTYKCNEPQGLVASHHALRYNLDQLVEELESRKLTSIRSVHWWNDKSPMWEVFTVAARDSVEQSRGAYSPSEYEATTGDSFAEESNVTLASSEPGSQIHDPSVG